MRHSVLLDYFSPWIGDICYDDIKRRSTSFRTASDSRPDRTLHTVELAL